VPFFGHLSWARKKGDKGADVLIPYPLRLGEDLKKKKGVTVTSDSLRMIPVA
jgi:hypothetical protein